MTIRLATEPDAPEIQIGVDLERMVDAAIEAMRGDTRIYQRAGVLVGVLDASTSPSHGIARGPWAPVIRPIPSPILRERLSSCVRWRRFDAKNKTYRPSAPPETVVSAVAARGEWREIRPLISVATCPCMRPDGSVLQEPGYDAATGILYRPSDAFPAVSESPSLEDARGALAALREVICDFPFASPAHESAWIAGVLTMLARPAIDGPVPLIAVDATTRGTGKSRLVDAAVKLVHGQAAARTSLPDDDEEMRKRITTLLCEGDPAILIDNITRAIALPSLDAVLTSEVWKDRLLGSNQSVSVPVRAVWWATGNNLSLGGDLSRRTLHIRMESPLENPEARTGFRHPELLRWVESNRRRLVAAGLTLLRAARIAGAPAPAIPWGSFEAWSAIVPAALIWAGAADPLEARATSAADIDEDRRALGVLLAGLARLCVDGVTLTARGILDALYPERDPHDAPLAPDGFEDLRETIEAVTRAPSGRRPEARRLGVWLQSVRGRVLSGRRVIRQSGGGDRAARWSVASA
jgi:hypothetical protein